MALPQARRLRHGKKGRSQDPLTAPRAGLTTKQLSGRRPSRPRRTLSHSAGAAAAAEEEPAVQIRLLPSSAAPDHAAVFQYLMSYLINDEIAIDAGAIGLYQTPQEQARVRHVFLSHSHLDHVASLPMFLENVYQGDEDGEPVQVYGTAPVLESLQRDLFNDRTWPDFIALSLGGRPFLRLVPIEPDVPVEVAGVRVTPVPVTHVVPTVAFVVEDATAGVAIVSDTGPTEAVWRHLNRLPNLRAVFLEASFPDELAWLADVSQHLTPALFRAEVRKLTARVPLRVIHIKPRHYDRVKRQLEALELPDVEPARTDRLYNY
jgi:ribonuclease BN (tRNA processing enzyme)